MEFYKSLLAALFIVTAISSVAWTAPLSYRPSDTEIVIGLSLMPKRANATKEVGYQNLISIDSTSLLCWLRNNACKLAHSKLSLYYLQMLRVYQFIASNRDLKETPLALGVADASVCSSNLVRIKEFNFFIHFKLTINDFSSQYIDLFYAHCLVKFSNNYFKPGNKFLIPSKSWTITHYKDRHCLRKCLTELSFL